jgi:uncharacterized protein (DUF1800 family)
MQQPSTAAIAANRFGLGARPGDLESIGGDARDWLRAQLKGAPPETAPAQLRSSQQILVDAFDLRREQQAARKAGAAAPAAAGEDAQAAAVLMKLPQFLRPIYMDEALARMQLAVASERPFLERLTQFWTNHFAVSVDKQFLAGLAGAFEREAIRPHVLGNFSDLLLAVETHPAMLLYLDNHLSVGPNSPAAQRFAQRPAQRKIGLNENLAREILELHTLGVGGGYTQQDVTTFAQVLTGWSIGGGAGRLFADGAPGRFVFRAQLHEPGAKLVLGRRYPNQGFDQGRAVLGDLAQQSACAHFVATKLTRHFIADEPPAPAVQRVAEAFNRSGGDLPTVYRALIDAREAWEQALAKYKTPSDYIVSTLRGLSQPIEAGKGVLAAFDQLGQRIWEPRSPAGWPDRSADWDGASALIKRIQWAQVIGEHVGSRRDAQQLAPQLLGANLTDATRTAVAHASSAAQAVTLLLAAPEFMRR